MLKRVALSLLLFAALLAAAASLRPWHSRWGATAEETHMTLPGDELMPFTAKQSTLAVTISAPPDKIWPWLAQMSADRGGLYSYSWLERLLNCPIHNANQVIPEYQSPQLGDLVKMCPGDFGPSPHEIAIIQPGGAFVFGGRDETGTAWDSTWQFVLIPVEANTTRLVLRLRSATASAFDAVFDPAFFLMERRRLQGIQERASGQLPAEWVSESEILLWIACFFLFLIALGLLVFRKDWRRTAILAGCIALTTLFLAFAQPPLWVDVLGVILVCAGIVGVFILPDLQNEGSESLGKGFNKA